MENLSRAELRNINRTGEIWLSLSSFSETDDAFVSNKPSVCPRQMVCLPWQKFFCPCNTIFCPCNITWVQKKGEALASPLYCICPEPKSGLRLQIYYIETPKSSIRAFFMTIPERISCSPDAIYEP